MTERKIALNELNIDDNTKAELDDWADQVIAWQMERIEKGEDLYLWFEPNWYVGLHDVWASPEWWIKIAESELDKPINLGALEILLAYKPEEYRSFAKEFLEKHFYPAMPDADDWYGTLVEFYPELEEAREALEEPEYDLEHYLWLNVQAWDRGYKPAGERLINYFQEEILDLDTFEPLCIYVFWDAVKILIALGKKNAETLFSEQGLKKLRSACLEVCEPSHEEYPDLIRLAMKMEWLELLTALEQNPSYLYWLFKKEDLLTFFRAYKSSEKVRIEIKDPETMEHHELEQEVLAWSLTPNKNSSQNLVYLGTQSIEQKPFTKTHFSLAVAWKRARSPIIFGARNREK